MSIREQAGATVSCPPQDFVSLQRGSERMGHEVMRSAPYYSQK